MFFPRPKWRIQALDIDSYHTSIQTYYDQDAADFEKRYWTNPILQRIRQSFRETVKTLSFERGLEIGCGPGIDIAHFAHIFPDKKLIGVDISSEMVRHAKAKIAGKNLNNARVFNAHTDDLNTLFCGEEFDLIFVFFGALNTVPNLDDAAEKIFSRLSPGGHIFVSFVNKYYLAEIFLQLLKCRPKRAFRRLGNSWGGYSDNKYLRSQCYSSRQVRRIFLQHAVEIQRSGYSIVYPAWYRARWVKTYPRITKLLWKIDGILNKSWLWWTGEYISFVFKKI